MEDLDALHCPYFDIFSHCFIGQEHSFATSCNAIDVQKNAQNLDTLPRAAQKQHRIQGHGLSVTPRISRCGRGRRTESRGRVCRGINAWEVSKQIESNQIEPASKTR